MSLMAKPQRITYEPTLQITSMTELGGLLRNRRKELGYTQEQVAQMMGCSPRLIGEAERGRGTVAFQTVVDYAIGLGIDLTAHVRGK